MSVALLYKSIQNEIWMQKREKRSNSWDKVPKTSCVSFRSHGCTPFSYTSFLCFQTAFSQVKLKRKACSSNAATGTASAVGWRTTKQQQQQKNAVYKKDNGSGKISLEKVKVVWLLYDVHILSFQRHSFTSTTPLSLSLPIHFCIQYRFNSKMRDGNEKGVSAVSFFSTSFPSSSSRRIKISLELCFNILLSYSRMSVHYTELLFALGYHYSLLVCIYCLAVTTCYNVTWTYYKSDSIALCIRLHSSRLFTAHILQSQPPFLYNLVTVSFHSLSAYTKMT